MKQGSPFRIVHKWDGACHQLTYTVGGRAVAGTKWMEHQPGISSSKAAELGCRELANQIAAARRAGAKGGSDG